MIAAYGVEQVRQAEAAATAALEDGELMQRAAAGLAEVVAARVIDLSAAGPAGEDGSDGDGDGDEDGDEIGRVVVLAGPGDNGGDALYAAADLARRGMAVAAIGFGADPGGAPWRAAAGDGVVLVSVDARAEDLPEDLPEDAAHLLSEASVVVDGLLGIGARPGLRGAMAAAAGSIPDDAYVIAVDLPSGADPAGVEPADPTAVFAEETVAFGCLKPVHLLPGTEPAVGRLTVVEIGIEDDLLEHPVAVTRLDYDDIADLWPVPEAADDKYSRGVLGVVAGSDRYPGAAVLATSAALEAGVGMVRYVGPSRPTDLVLAANPEVVPGGGRAQAWLLGPGIDPADIDAGQREAIATALASDLPCLVDAGALELIDGARGAPTLLTPHAGELARLLTRLGEGDVDRAGVTAHPVRHLRRAAELTGATVLLKGSTTLIGEADGTIGSQADGPVWLATAGSGDVLAGLAGALLAQGFAPAAAGQVASLVHGVAAERANPGGPVRATAVAAALPEAVAYLLAR